MKKNRWWREARAWANGAEIEYKFSDDKEWTFIKNPTFDELTVQYRIKQEYLYVYSDHNFNVEFKRYRPSLYCSGQGTSVYIGKIKLEQEDEKS
jgi:hypothetical protein